MSQQGEGRACESNSQGTVGGAEQKLKKEVMVRLLLESQQIQVSLGEDPGELKSSCMVAITAHHQQRGLLKL